jgi:general secretion pathway protein C
MLPSDLPHPHFPVPTVELSRRLAALVSLLLVFACAASAGYWGLRLLARPRPVPAAALQVGGSDVDSLAAGAVRLFGATAARVQEAAPARYRLWGVIGGGRQAGAALIGVDGAAPRAIAVGASVAPGVTLESTAYGVVLLGRDGGEVELKLQPQAGAPSVPGAMSSGGGLPPGVMPMFAAPPPASSAP